VKAMLQSLTSSYTQQNHSEKSMPRNEYVYIRIREEDYTNEYLHMFSVKPMILNRSSL
jgi:hypothetical protein